MNEPTRKLPPGRFLVQQPNAGLSRSRHLLHPDWSLFAPPALLAGKLSRLWRELPAKSADKGNGEKSGEKKAISSCAD